MFAFILLKFKWACVYMLVCVCVAVLHSFTVICVNICTKIIRLHARDFVGNKIDAAPLCVTFQTLGFCKTEFKGIWWGDDDDYDDDTVEEQENAAAMWLKTRNEKQEITHHILCWCNRKFMRNVSN